MGETRIYSAPPYGLFQTELVNPSNAVYIPRSRAIAIFAWTSVALVTLEMNGLLLRPDGQISEFAESFALTNVNDWTTYYFEPGEGFLLSARLYDDSGYATAGSTWAKVGLRSKASSDGDGLGMLSAGPVWSTMELGVWPPSELRVPSTQVNPTSILGADPAAGAEISYTVPGLSTYRLRAFRATLVTAAVAVTRQVHLQITDGTNVVLDIPANASEIISLTRVYNAAAFGTAPAATDTQIYINLPPDLWVPAGWKITTLTTALDPGDNWSAPRLVVDAFPYY